MTFFQRARVVAILTTTCLTVATARGQVSGDATISANDPAFGQITVSTSSQYAGAVSSIRWHDKEFINNWDHGRQLQPNSEFFNRYECYNPYEAGSKDDGSKPTTSSRLLALAASGNQLESTTQMAWYMSTREPRGPGYGDNCGDPKDFLACPPLAAGETLSKYQVHKTVRIGLPGIPNVIEYKSDLFIPEAVLKGLNQITAVVPWDFSTVRTYDVVSKGYRDIRSLGGGDDSTKVVATPD
ncbi:MAG: hypothetical protein M3Z64_10430, partial [Verrucomicrobiota bacterium]|nr:hypothetical protein [Verrucomicrobiota bacterium]